MNRCAISFEALADYHDNRADESSAARIREHLERDCKHCRESLAWLERTAVTMREAASVSVSASLLERLHNVYVDRFRLPVRKSWMARLTFDSRATPALAGARGNSEGAFQLNFSTDEHDVDIWEESSGQDRWYIIGQVLPKEGDGAVVPDEVVFKAEDGAEITTRPDSPEFHVPVVPTGIYQVTLRMSDSEIRIADLSVGQVKG